MAKKDLWIDVDLVWGGTTASTEYKGKTYTVTSADEVWNTTGVLWTDDIITILERITIGGSRGGVRTKQDTWNAWDNIGEKNKKKVVRVILTMNKVQHITEQDINKYKVTIEDIEMVLDAYEKYKVTIENVEIK